MPRGRNTSGLNRNERLEKAFTYFAKGYKNADVARLLRIAPDTATRYRQKYEDHLADTVRENPRMLNDVLGNTVRIVEEIDLVRADAWKRLNKNTSTHVCEECGCHLPMQTSAVTSLHKVILDSISHRMRLFGLLGVKQEYFLSVQKIQIFQAKVLEWLATQLCQDDREKFEAWMVAELGASEQGTETAMPAIPVRSTAFSVPGGDHS